MNAALAPHLEAQREPMKAALAEMVRIPSVCQEGGDGTPFGEAVDQALRKALQIKDAPDTGLRQL